MMRYKGTIILLILVILLGLYLSLIELPSQKAKQQEEERAQTLLQFEPHDAIAISLTYPNRQTDREILLEKETEEKWQIVKPIMAQADQNEVETLISSLKSMKMERVVEDKAQDLKIYGLEDPEVRVSLKLKDHEEHLLLGDQAPVGSTVYAKKGGEDSVRLIGQYYKTGLMKTLTDLRKKEVLDFDPQHVIKMSLEYPGKAFVLSRENGQWWIKNPGAYKADEDEVSEVLNYLRRLKAKAFVDEGQSEIIKTFEKPQFKLEMENENTSTAILSIYQFQGQSKDQQKVYAVTNRQYPIYLIEPQVITDLNQDLFTLRDKHLLTFDQAKVQAIEIRKSSEEPLTLRREGENWNYEGQPLEETQRKKISDLLEYLLELKAEKILDESPKSLKPYGLLSPSIQISLFDSLQDKLAEIVIGDKKDDLVYARNESAETIYLIRDEMIQDLRDKSDLQEKTAQKPPQ